MCGFLFTRMNSIRRRNSRCICQAAAVSLVFVVLFVMTREVKYSSNVGQVYNTEVTNKTVPGIRPTNQGKAVYFKDYIVDTPTCKIPNLDPWDKSIKQYDTYPNLRLRCPSLPLLTYVDGQWLRISKTVLKESYKNDLSSCEYHGIKFFKGSDHKFEYAEKDGTVFKDDVIPKYEYVKVQCYNKNSKSIYLYYHSIVLLKPDVEKRCDQADAAFRSKHPTFKRFNVAAIGLDAMSRSNFVRSLSKTRQYLVRDLKAFELRGHHVIADGTMRNMLGFLAGGYIHELVETPSRSMKSADGVPFIWKDFSKSGYRVMYNEDAAFGQTFTMFGPGFTEQPTDYYSRPLDLAISRDSRIRKGTLDACIGPKLEVEFVLDYTRRFMKTFENKPHFTYTFLSRITHDYGNNAKVVDATYRDNLKMFHEQGLLNDTVLFVYGDHGMRYGALRRQYVGSLEERLPGMYIILPPSFYTRFPQHAANLKKNVNRLTSHLDIYATLKDLLEFSGEVRPADLSKRGISLFSEIPIERTCEHASLDAHWCTCRKAEVVTKDNLQVRRAAQTLIDDFNKELSIYNGKCATVSLKAIFSVTKLVDITPSMHDFYRMVVQISPGSGILEATFLHSLTNNTMTWTRELSRTNWYGNAPRCINYKFHKLFCVCK